MTKRILWLDNDRTYIKYYVRALGDEGYEVTVKKSVSEIESAINDGGTYALLIMDIMIPSVSEEEEKRYPPEETDRGLKMGLVFYRRMKGALDSAGTKVLAMTARLDESIQNEFAEAGLPGECFTTKVDVAKVPAFLKKVGELIGAPE
jgi:CheY-like chemotaxis protein